MKIPVISPALNWAYQQIAYYTQPRPSDPNQETTLSSYETAPSSTEQTTWNKLKKAARSFLNSLFSFFRKPASPTEIREEPPSQKSTISETTVGDIPIASDKGELEKTDEQIAESIPDEIQSLLQHPTYGPCLMAINTKKLIENIKLIKKKIAVFENKNRENRFLQQSFIPSQIAPIINFGIGQLNGFEKNPAFFLSSAIFFEEFQTWFDKEKHKQFYPIILQNYFAKFCEILAQIKDIDHLSIYKHLRAQLVHEKLPAFDHKVYSFLIDEKFRYLVVNEFSKFLFNDLNVNKLILGLKLLRLGGYMSEKEHSVFLNEIMCLLNRCGGTMKKHPNYQLLNAYFLSLF